MLKGARFYLKEAQLRITYMVNKDCIFCKIIAGEIKSKPVFESESVIAIYDINPVAKVHILIISKNHIESVMTIDHKNSKDIIEMFAAAQKLVLKNNLSAYRLAFNGGSYQHVPHLHMHLVAGGKVEWSKL